MTKQEILVELDFLTHGFAVDSDQLVITGKASEVLYTGKEDPSIENIEVWTDPNYYDSLIEEEYVEVLKEEGPNSIRNIPFSFYHYEGDGKTKLYRGDLIGPKPKSKQIQGYNVQVLIQEAATARIIDFKQK